MQKIVTANDVIDEIGYCSEDDVFLNNCHGILSLVNDNVWVNGIVDDANDFMRQNTEKNILDAIHFALYCYWNFEYDEV